LGLLLILVAAASSCDRGPGAKPTLRSEERILVDLYVDITKLEALRADQPDSVGPGLDRLSATADTVAVRRALDGLRKDPSRWAIVYDEIAQRLRAIEESTDPAARLPSGSAVPVPRVSD
jgi:hypothetical protein